MVSFKLKVPLIIEADFFSLLKSPGVTREDDCFIAIELTQCPDFISIAKDYLAVS